MSRACSLIRAPSILTVSECIAFLHRVGDGISARPLTNMVNVELQDKAFYKHQSVNIKDVTKIKPQRNNKLAYISVIQFYMVESKP